MKKKLISKTFVAIGLAAILLLSMTMTALAATSSTTIVRTRPWDGIKQTLGGVPKSVRKIEHKGSVFYLAPNVSDDDFIAVLAIGPEAVKLKPPKENEKLYQYPVFILWNSEKNILLVHPIIWDYDDILETVAIPAEPPVSLTGAKTAKVTPKEAMTAKEAQEYMLSVEYANAVRTEFYRLLNEHRVANGLKELKVNVELQGYADVRAEEQRTRSGHTRPDGKSAGSGWYNSKNVLNSRYAENALNCGAISADPKDTALGIFTIWKESKGHNRHMLYDFDSHITMAFGISPKLDDDGFVTSGAIFATGY